MLAALLLQVGNCPVFRPGGAIWTHRSQCVIDVYDCKKPRGQWNLILFKPVWVARPVPLFVMIEGDISRRAQIGNGREQFISIAWMLADYVPFLNGEGARFQQNAIGKGHFANIVKDGPPPDMDEFGFAQSQAAR